MSDRRKLPDGWRWTTLESVCEIIAGQSPPSDTYRSAPEGLPFFQGKADFGARHPIPRVWCIAPQKIAKAGDILISVRAPVGPTNVADVECCIGRGLSAIRPNLSIVDSDFILYALKISEKTLAEQGSGSTFAAIGQNNLRALEIPLPPLPEQRRIVVVLEEKLAAVEQARQAARAQLDAARALPAAYLRKIFEGDEAREWPRYFLSDIAAILGGVQKTPDRAPVHFYRPYLTVRNVQRGFVDFSDIRDFELTRTELDRYRLQAGDILFVEGNGSLDHIGRNALFNGEIEDCIHQNHVIRVRVNRELAYPQFVSQFFNSPMGQSQMVDKARTSSGLYTLSGGKVAVLEIPLPSLATQQLVMDELSSRLNSAEAICSELEQQVSIIEALPAAYLQQAFSGEL